MSTVTIYPSSDYSIGCSGYPSNPARYSYIDESSPATTDYNFKYGVSTGQDLFGMSAHGQSTGVISNLAFSVYYTTQGNPGSCQLKVRIAANGTVYNFGSALGAVSNFNTGTVNLTTNPYTNAAWTWSDITNAKFGYYLTASTSGKYVIVAQMQITITYTLPPPTPTGLTATTNLSNKVTLSWSSGGADGPTTGYYVYRNGVHIGTTASTSFDDTGATAPYINNGTITASDGSSTAHVSLSMAGASTGYTNHTYTVVAYGSGGESSATSGVTGRRIAGPLYYQFKRYDGSPDWVNVGSNTTTSSYNDTGAPAPTITPGSSVASDGTYTDKVALSLSGTSNNVGATRIYSCYLTAAGCSDVWSGQDNGYRAAGTLSYQWQVSADGSSYSNIPGATTSSYNYTDAPAPTITPGTAAASDGTSVAYVSLSLSGQSVAVGATRYYRCYLTASPATAQYSTANTGYRAAGTLSYQWQVSADGSSYSNIPGATTSSYNYTSAPAPTITPGSATATNGNFTDKIELTNPGISNNNGEVRYYKCYLTAASATAQYSSSDSGYRSAGTSACQWQMSAENTDANYSNISGATTVNYTYISGPNDSRYFRLYITASPASAVTSTPAVGRRSNGLYLFHG